MRAELNQGLIDFLKASPTPFHATASLARRLEAAGYRRLDERDAWHTETGGRYYVTRNDSSLIAIRLGRRSPLESGFRLVGAHTDSPCLRVKPNPEIARNGFLQLGVEVYGGALFAPWFDRDLSLAGRVTFRANGKLESRLVETRQVRSTNPAYRAQVVYRYQADGREQRGMRLQDAAGHDGRLSSRRAGGAPGALDEIR